MLRIIQRPSQALNTSEPINHHKNAVHENHAARMLPTVFKPDTTIMTLTIPALLCCPCSSK